MSRATSSSQNFVDRETLQASSNVSGAPQDANFHKTHLNPIPPELLEELRSLTPAEELNLEAVIKPTKREIGMYAPMADLLTSLSNRIYDNLPDEVKEGLQIIEFIPNNRNLMTFHPGKDYPTSYAPDVVGIEGSRDIFWVKGKWQPIPYHFAVVDAELKPDGKGHDDGTSQAISYTWYQMQACPHRPGVYCLNADPKAYTIGWVDASGPIRSPPYLWKNPEKDKSGDSEVPKGDSDDNVGGVDECVDVDAAGNGGEDCAESIDGVEDVGNKKDEGRVQDEHNGKKLDEESDQKSAENEDLDADEPYRLSVLFSCLYSLYVPKAGHSIRDTTIKPCGSRDSQLDGAATWNITCKGVVYRDCKLISSYPPWGRRTAIFETKDRSIRTIIKDYWIDNARRFNEIEVLDQVHSQGKMPGVVQALHSEYVEVAEGQRLTTGRQASAGVENRSRIRLVFQSVGEDLQKVKSLKELLNVFFDLNEAHRAVLKTGVLHRDISANNILIHPVHRGQGRGVKYNDGPKFISDILSGSSSSKRKKDTSQCLLIDFDNSAMLDDSEGSTTETNASKALAHRTGTPMYIARAISIGHRQGDLPEHQTFLRMPELSGKSRELYNKTWGEQVYALYCDNGETRHGAIIPAEDELYNRWETGITEDINHQPCHDVESMFWSLYVTSIQVVPKCDEPDMIRQPFIQAWEALQEHQIGDPRFQECDARDAIMVNLPRRIRRMLHPGFSSSPLPKLLTALVEHIRPEYELIREELPHQDHLHEAMRRLLLDCIVEMEGKPDIEFDTEKRRTPDYLAGSGLDGNAPERGRKKTPLAGNGSSQFMSRLRPLLE